MTRATYTVSACPVLGQLISGSQTSMYSHQADSSGGGLRYGEYLAFSVCSGSNPRFQAGTLFPLGASLSYPGKQSLPKINTLPMQRLLGELLEKLGCRS